VAGNKLDPNAGYTPVANALRAAGHPGNVLVVAGLQEVRKSGPTTADHEVGLVREGREVVRVSSAARRR
jgi:hypothetical protein